MKTREYAVTEIFDTLQGEGCRAGRRSVFVRLSGCNLWSGFRSKRVGQGACAAWCDTDFLPRMHMRAAEIVARCDLLWEPGQAGADRWVVLTGGEPMLQVDAELLDEFHDGGWSVAVETNGTRRPPEGSPVDLLTCSPKLGGPVVLDRCDELKVVLPGLVGPDRGLGCGWSDEELLSLYSRLRPSRCYVQPMDLDDPELNRACTQRCVEFVRRYPWWALSMQLHKIVGLP